MKLQRRDDALPEPRLVVVDDQNFDEPGAGHLEQIFVLELLGSRHDDHRLEAALREVVVEFHEAVVVAARLADEHLLTGEVVERVDGGAIRSGDDDLLHVRDPRIREVDQLLAIGRHGEVGHHHVAAAVEQRRQQLIARNGHEEHVHLQVPVGHRLVQLGFEQPTLVGGGAPLGALVDEVEGAVVGGQDADGAALLHPIEVSRPLGENGLETQPGAALLGRRLRAGLYRGAGEHHRNAHRANVTRCQALEMSPEPD